MWFVKEPITTGETQFNYFRDTECFSKKRTAPIDLYSGNRAWYTPGLHYLLGFAQRKQPDLTEMIKQMRDGSSNNISLTAKAGRSLG
jgi:hypothetical protein